MPHFKLNKIRTELTELIQILKKYKFEDNNSIELHNLQNIVGNGKELNKYKTKELIFNIPKTTGMQKKTEGIKTIKVILDLNYEYEEKLNAHKDIFKSYNLQLYIKGFDSDQEETNFFCWHLDREPNTDGNLIHPYYHIHAGGNKLNGYNVGDLLMIGSPRISHPPLDVILAVHFIILNFFHSKEFENKKELLNDYNYISLIKKAQKRVLDPYFDSFNGSKHKDYTKETLFPLYV